MQIYDKIDKLQNISYFFSLTFSPTVIILPGE